MEELLQLKNDEAVCTSLQVAEKFGKRHDSVLRKIEQIIEETETTKLWFQKSAYKSEDNNKKYPMFYMNRDGFSILAMGFTGKKATEWKIKYIEAFNKMEQMLKERSTETWLESRKQGKLTRQAETDVIKQLVEYAKEQGSTHSNLLYMTYTKLANAMAGVKNRDTATVYQLNTLSFIENIILNQIQIGINRGMNYKDIYKDCKKQIVLFKDIAYLE